MSRIQANLLLLLAAAIWGGGFVAQSTAMQGMTPNWFNGLRFGLATVAVLPFAVREARMADRSLSVGEWLSFAMVGVVLLGSQTTQQIGLQTTSVTNASFLTGLYVVFVPVIAVFARGRRPHWIVWPAAGMTLLGILLLSGGALSALSRGDILIIICAVFLAAQISLTGLAVGRSGRPLALALSQFAICAVGGLLGGAAFEPFSLEGLSSVIPQIIYAGLFSSGLAFVLQIVGQRHTTAPQAAIVLSSEALFGALFGALMLGEMLAMPGYVGCALIFAAMLVVELVPEYDRRRNAAA